MALAYRTAAVGGNTTSGTSPTASITPVVDDLFLVFCQATGNTNTAPTCSDNNSSGAYTLLFTAASDSSANTLSCFVRTTLLGSTSSTTVTVACGAHTAVEICVVAISGASTAGTAAIAQYATQTNQSGSTVPAPSLSDGVLLGDLVLSAVGNITDPAGVTVSAAGTLSTTWTLNENTGQTACGLGVESSVPIFGNPSGAVTWGGNSASAFASCAVEIMVPVPEIGVNAAKVQVYGVLGPPQAVNAAKVQVYGVLGPPQAVNVAKIQVYAALNTANTNPPVWPAVNPPVGYVNNGYSYSWDLTPAAPPTTYTISSGSLPPGLSLSSPGGSSGDVGEITGTPTTVGTYTFTVLATNTYGTAPQPMSITISAPVGGNYGYIG